MKPVYFILFSLSVLSYTVAKKLNPAPNKITKDFQKLSDEFIHPPSSSRPGAYWCWLNGDVTNASITHDLEEMKAKGMGRAEIWDVAAMYNPGKAYGTGPEFLGQQSVKSIQYALSEGKRLGIKMGLIGSSGWNAGGSWVKPGWAAKALYYSECKVKGPLLFSDTLPFPSVPAQCPKDKNGRPVYYKEVAVLAIPDNKDRKIVSLNDVRILNKNFNGKILKWEIPTGNWTLLRFICSNTGQHLIVPSPNSNGLFIDFLDPDATKKHLKYMLDRLGITTDNAEKSGLTYLSFDSMELDEATSWTDSMDSIFHDHNGYDILPYLPAFARWNLPGGNDEFLSQFKKTVSDQLILSHYITGRKFLARYGIQLVAEAGGPGPPIWNSCPVEALKALGNVSVPRGEFWIRNRYNIFLVKEIASASHIYGLHLTDAESFTTWRRWKDAPHDLKPYVDRAFCEGLNSITMHAFANTRPEFGFPGRAYHAGSDINPTTTWWEDAKPFMDYLSRCSYMLRQGQSVADIAYYYGDKAPHFFPELQGSPDRTGLIGLSFGYDFDLINTDVLLNRMTVSRGKLILPDGLNYKLLVIPDKKDIPIAVWKKIERLIAGGAHVLIQNSSSIPQHSISSDLVNVSIDAALRKLSIAKDFTGDADKLDFIHRKTDIADIYFVRNKTDQNIVEDCQFRSTGKQVEFWDPVTRQQYLIKTSETSEGKAKLKLQLPPNGSCFIIFSSQRRQLPGYYVAGSNSVTQIKGPWTLSFPRHRGAPDSVKLDTLISWTDYPDSGVKYFSGTATYKKNIAISSATIKMDSLVVLDLGNVRDVAEVIVNGRSSGILWTYPFKLNIKSYLKPGENIVEIKITNMWVNRLTGDMNLPKGKKFCQTNVPDITQDRSPVGDEKYHVQPSGLFGPVTIEAIQYKSIR
ncbi:hypothetical protein FW778_19650 [Ginsengibacter hankyongi]|uniref:Glycosyl hydrolases family 2 sugar binding domain-containing protein n=1 Tax=Ginsengibacter hankyongi TaxID=2607284 RepID=A0A5J5IDT0_9BACT|nr:glycosyl hydrolase [Ginsengibacter hankyongi]KAA9036106.1 hypothetical protein FW778_19650 [Ginsengibacter hankyongi]